MKRKTAGKVVEAEMKKEETAKAEEMKAEAKQAEPKEAEDGEEMPGEEDHEDVEKDKELILAMTKKYMGDEAEGMDEAAEGAACEAYEAYAEMGKEKEEAMKCAAEAMKLAKHMAKKHAESEKASEAEEKPEADEEKDEKEEVKESSVKLAARIAFLERKLKGYELAAALDKKLAESKLGRAETDKIRTLIGEPKSEAQIEHTIKVFKEAFSMSAGSESRSSSFASLFVTGTEKQTGDVQSAKVNFSECVKF